MERLIEDAGAVFDAALRSVQPDRLLERSGWTDGLRQPLDAYGRVVVIALGKASMGFAGAVETALGDRLDAGVAVVPHGYPSTFPARLKPPARLDVIEADHPVPGLASRRAARRILELAARCEEGDLLLVCISGGGTALSSDFAGGISLEAAQRTFRLLLEGGADIHAMNTVRKHLSTVGGGRLARAAAPADVLALAVSDVVGDALSVIASGPTVPDPTTFEEAVAVLKDHALWDATPEEVRRHLLRGVQDAALETPKQDDPAFARAETVLIGTNLEAREAAAQEAQRRGYRVDVAADLVTGEAREAGRRLAEAGLSGPADGPWGCIWGGETTVRVTGTGRGGRNQELALGAALRLDGVAASILLLSGGTDGIDGPTDAAGAWVTPATVAQARRAGLDPIAALKNNDAYPFFERIGHLLKPGPTHTNVMDLQVVLRR